MTKNMGENETNDQPSRDNTRAERIMRVTEQYAKSMEEFEKAYNDMTVSRQMLVRFAQINLTAYEEDVIQEDPFVENMGVMANAIAATPETEREASKRAVETYAAIGWELVARKGRWGMPASMSDFKVVALQ